MSIFYIVILIGFVAVSVVSYITYKTTRDDHYKENEYYVQMVNLSMQNMLDQYELSLDILGKRLLENRLFENSQKTDQILNTILRENDAFVGFGLIATDGHFIFTSKNVDITKMGNLKENPETAASFLQTLHSKHLVVGRTYFVKGLGKWVIPLRKALYDEKGNPLAIIATGIELDRKGGFFNNLKLKNSETILVVKELKGQFYRIFYSGNDVQDKTFLYGKPIENAVSNAVMKSLQEEYSLTLKKLREVGKDVTVSPACKNFSDEDVFISIVYNKKYDLWVSLSEAKKDWLEEALKTIFIYYALFFTLSFFLYLLFRSIDTAEKQKIKELHYQATHDTLTKLPNRLYLNQSIKKIIKRFGGKFTVFFLDLDNFKSINDKFGHHVGDAILQNIGKRLDEFFREDRLLVRQGGDEFIIFVPLCNEDEKEELANALLTYISKPCKIDNMEFIIRASIGSADYPDDCQDIETLFSYADIAMYAAKKNKNAYSPFSKEMKEESLTRLAIEHELNGALQNSEFWMVYQPQIKADGSLHGVEALIRWKNEKLGFVPPDKFISVAEEMGLMDSIGDFIIDRTLKEIKMIKEELDISFSVSINISVKQMMESNFLEKLLSKIEHYSCVKNEITIEITESLFIEDMEYILPILEEVKHAGLKISLDDFGTGYSSLSILKRLPIDELKIDKSFIDDILTDTQSLSLVEDIIQITHHLSKSSLAEGTETLQQVEKLRACECEIFQGYYFSKPLTKEDLKTYIYENFFMKKGH